MEIAIYECENCGLTQDPAEGPVYECGSCGEIFIQENSRDGRNQCDSCGKRAAKIAEKACGACDGGLELQPDAIVCRLCSDITDESLFEDTDCGAYREHLAEQHLDELWDCWQEVNPGNIIPAQTKTKGAQ